MGFPRLPAGRQNASRIGGLTGQAPPSSTSKSVGMWGWVSPAHCPGVVGGSPRRFVPDITTVLAGEPPAEWFDRLPPRQLAPSRESWRLSISEERTLPNIPREECTRGTTVYQSTPILLAE